MTTKRNIALPLDYVTTIDVTSTLTDDAPGTQIVRTPSGTSRTLEVA